MAEATQQLRIFVSHSHEDDAFCRAIVTALRDAGADVWYDEHNMGSGLLMSVIQSELGTRPVFVVILSKAAFASEWVKREATWAYQMAEFDPTRTILPVTATHIAREDFTPASGWFFLYGYKRI
ncbi:MAG TPA: toll/interleukin-1 receptor domain-containing protein, partial [Ktedonobacterales bacterium]